MNINTKSPNQNHTAELVYEGEIRFGPAYFKLKVDGKLIPDKLFGDKLFWSPDSKYLAAEEWLTTDYGEGPITRLLLINLILKKAVAFKTVYHGFVRQVQFTDSAITYVKEYSATGRGNIADVEFSNIKEWSDIGL